MPAALYNRDPPRNDLLIVIDCCPRDNTALVTHRIKDFVVKRCPKCAGLWLPSETRDKLVGHIDHDPAPKPALSTPAMWCPIDRMRLVPMKHRGIEIDVCNACDGVWLDGGELERIFKRKSKENGSNIPDMDGDSLTAFGDLAIEGITTIAEFVIEALSGL